jgi:hypothetical protein
MTNWTFLQVAANFATIANTLASWDVGSVLAIPAYDAIRLRTQVNRLRDEQYILTRVVFPDNYNRLTIADRHRVISALGRCVLTAHSMSDGFSLSFLASLEDPIRNCYDRYLTLPTLGWLQYGPEVYNLHMAIRILLKRLDEVRRDIEVRRRQVY